MSSTTTIRDIAKITGFSVATVSRAFDQNAYVKQETREAILDAAGRLNYRPDPMAKALATRRTKTIGAVIPNIENSIFARYISSLETTLAENGYALVLATNSNNPDVENKRALDLLNMGAEGLLLSGLQHSPSLLKDVQLRNMPVICTSIYDSQSDIPTIGYDNKALGFDATKYLKSLGHRKIVVFHGPVEDNDRTRLRIEGVKQAASDILFIEVPLTVPGGSEGAKKLFEKQTNITAILCLSDVLAQGVLFEAARRDISIPGDLSLMGFDDLDWAAHSMPALTTIHLPVEEMGRQAAQSMIDFLDHRNPIPSKLLEGQIIERKSTLPLSQDSD